MHKATAMFFIESAHFSLATIIRYGEGNKTGVIVRMKMLNAHTSEPDFLPLVVILIAFSPNKSFRHLTSDIVVAKGYPFTYLLVKRYNTPVCSEENEQLLKKWNNVTRKYERKAIRKWDQEQLYCCLGVFFWRKEEFSLFLKNENEMKLKEGKLSFGVCLLSTVFC